MSYKSWFDAHAQKHRIIVERLAKQGCDKAAIIDYFEYENMQEYEKEFCPLYIEGKKCHDSEYLSCYLCACPNFRFADAGLCLSYGVVVYSKCGISSKDGKQENYGGKIHQNCSACTVPHDKKYVVGHFDTDWKNIMKECENILPE